MPRFNVCKASDETNKDMLNQEVMFLLMLKNMRYISYDKPVGVLTAEQIKELFEEFKNRLKFEKNKKREGKKSIDILFFLAILSLLVLIDFNPAAFFT